MTKLEYEQAKMLVSLQKEVDCRDKAINKLDLDLGLYHKKLQNLEDESLKSLLPEATVSLDVNDVFIKSRKQEPNIISIGFNNINSKNNMAFLKIMEKDKDKASLALSPEAALELAANLIKIATYKYE